MSTTEPTTPFDNLSANERQVGGDHYKGVDYQHWDLCWDLRLQHLPAAITKYVTRHPKKKGLEDLAKAMHYAEKYMEVLGHRTEVPFPRVLDGFNGEGQVYSPQVAVYVNQQVLRYVLANDLKMQEAQIIGLLCAPHDSNTLSAVQSLIRDTMDRDYPLLVGAAHYTPDHEDDSAAEAGPGYVAQGRDGPAPVTVRASHPLGKPGEGLASDEASWAAGHPPRIKGRYGDPTPLG